MSSRFVAKLKDLTSAVSGWRVLRDGVDMIRLWGEPNVGPTLALLRYAPGATVPRHVHTGYELIVVLSGSQSDERGTYASGSVVMNPAGDEHSVHSAEGCIVLIVWERPIEFV